MSDQQERSVLRYNNSITTAHINEDQDIPMSGFVVKRETPIRNGATLTFEEDYLAGQPTAITASAIYFDLSTKTPRVGVMVQMKHNSSAAPALPSSARVVAGSYVPGQDNIITFQYVSNTEVRTWIVPIGTSGGGGVDISGKVDNFTAQVNGPASVVKFDRDRIMGEPTACTGNITFNTSGAVVGVTVEMRHNASTKPTLPASARIAAGCAYLVNQDNIFHFRYISSMQVRVYISQLGGNTL